MNKKHFVCISPIRTQTEAFIARFCFALMYDFINATFANGRFLRSFFFVCVHSTKSISCIFNDHLTKACWHKPLKCGKNKIQKGKKCFNVFKYTMCVCIKDKSENKAITRINEKSLANAFFFSGGWYVACSHYCLIAYVAFSLL